MLCGKPRKSAADTLNLPELDEAAPFPAGDRQVAPIVDGA